MANNNDHNTLSTGLAGLTRNFKHDFIASITVALVTIPLGLGIAIAAGAPPISGIIPSIIGGLITTFYRGSHVAVNGPTKSLIVIIFSSILYFGGGIEGFRVTLAAFVCAGAIQVILGLLKVGKYADFFPASVINGMMAVIGLIIFTKQLHVIFGGESHSVSPIDDIEALSHTLTNLNPLVTIIGVIGLLVLIFHSKIKNAIVHIIPGPVWLLILTVPFVFIFGFLKPHDVTILGSTFYVGPEFLTSIPDSFLQGIVYPDFSQMGSHRFWLAVATITLLASIESLMFTKAVDKLDVNKRRSDLNRDLVGVGVSTIASGMIGGLPVITTIIQSSLNVNHGARTQWSNLYQGIILLVAVLFLTPAIQILPQAALAALLVYTGYKLFSPKVFADAYRKGIEQLLVFLSTFVVIIFTGKILAGIGGGIITALIIHLAKTNLPVNIFGRYLLNLHLHVTQEEGRKYYIKIRGIANFVNLVSLIRQLDKVPEGLEVVLDFSHARLVDYTVLEYVHDYADRYIDEDTGAGFHIIGLDDHDTSSDHPNALHVLHTRKNYVRKLTRRQSALKSLAADHGWFYRPEVSWDTSMFRKFMFFISKPIEFKKNSITGTYKSLNVKWEVCDITFDEGSLLETEVYHTSVQVLLLPYKIPPFTLQEETFYDRIIAHSEDIDFEKCKGFSRKFMLKGRDREAIKKFFHDDLLAYLEDSEVYHMESNGRRLFIFKYTRLASPAEIEKMIGFTEKMVGKFNQQEVYDNKDNELNNPTDIILD